MKKFLMMSTGALLLILLNACTPPPSSGYSPVIINPPGVTPYAIIPANYRPPSMNGMLQIHNRVRAEVGVPPLTWSPHLAQYSREWAGHLAYEQGCRMIHRQEAGKDFLKYGENLFWASPEDSSFGTRDIQRITAPQVAIAWASEKPDYHYPSNSCRPGRQCGHYTQMVWRSTQQVGCGMSLCPNLGQIWVCSYAPPGNWMGQRPY